MIRLFVCVKPFSLSRFYVFNCTQPLHSIDIQIGDIFELQKSAKGVDSGNVILTYESSNFGKSARKSSSCMFIEVPETYLSEYFEELKFSCNYAICIESCSIQTVDELECGDEALKFNLGDVIMFHRNYHGSVSIYENSTNCSKEYVISKHDFRKYFSRLYAAKP